MDGGIGQRRDVSKWVMADEVPTTPYEERSAMLISMAVTVVGSLVFFGFECGAGRDR